MADPNPPVNDPVDEAFAAYLRSCDAGEVSSREEFLAQFPEIADELSELMDAADAIGQMTTGHSAPKGDSPRPIPFAANPGADTIVGEALHRDGAETDPAVTLPMANRAKGDPGPTLPYDLGDYLLLEVLGRGGMGVVYLAKQRELDRQVAVKMIRSGILADEDEVKRFYTEAQAVARLHHRGIVGVHQFGRRAGHHFFSMEYIPGSDLQKKINGEELEPELAARYVRDVARAIHHAHGKGVLHRDLKPANVLVDLNDQVHVTDFGLAKHMDGDSSVTGTGAAVGTPHYMAPEQAGGHSDRASHESDVYALGAILFACLTGRPPIVADTIMQTLVNVVHNPAPPVRSFRPEVSIDLETIVAKCLEKVPIKRYSTAEQLANELDAYLEGRPIVARPRHRVIKLWQWLEGVPLVGALTGRRVLDTSASHRRFQAGMLMMLLVMPILASGLFTLWQHQKQTMPRIVRIAGGIDGGVYNDVSTEIANRLKVAFGVATDTVPTSGSLDNRNRLLSGHVDLAPMQATAISGDYLCVIAPLFYEVLYVVARSDSEITSMEDLRGHRVAVGTEGSGSRATAELVLNAFELSADLVVREVVPWEALQADDSPAAAMICIGRGSPLVSKLLSTGDWRLIPIAGGIEISLAHPTLRPMTIGRSEFPSADLAPSGVETVGTIAFLAADTETPSALVRGVLDALYEEPELCVGLIPRNQAAEWQGLAFHPEARRYFEQSK
jgi:TRAP transporter TAXI family solute receptor